MNFFQEALRTATELTQHDSMVIQKSSQTIQDIDIPDLKIRKSKVKRNTPKILYNWNKTEQRKYINFLIRRRSLFNLSNEQRKCTKINVVMSKAIRSRSAAQCHSHHQKMVIKFGTIEGIIAAHVHFIKKQTVPKAMRSFFDSILKGNQSLLREIQEADVIRGQNQIDLGPLWMEYADLFGYSGHYFAGDSSFDF